MSKKENTEEDKKICLVCKSENDKDANFCKMCGSRLKRKIDKKNGLLSLSRIFKILSIVIALDTLFLAKPHMGTAKWDNIIIGYGLLLSFTLILSSIFRLLGSEKNWNDLIHNRKEFFDEITSLEFKMIIGIIICIIVLSFFSYSRLMFLKPGNNYVDNKLKRYVTRWGDVTYERLGTRKCPGSLEIWNSKLKTIPHCYEYNYQINFKDGKSCVIRYKTRYDKKMNEETFSYCAKK